MNYTVKLTNKQKVTHDTVQLTLERPANYRFTPGQYTELTITMPDGTAGSAPFSFIGLQSDPALTIMVKHAPANAAINGLISQLEEGTSLQISAPWDEVAYKSPGVFIAGGTGIAPFMAIFRQLRKDGKLEGSVLLYANKRGEDICFEGELYTMFGTRFHSILALEDRPRNTAGEVDAAFIHHHVQQLDQPFQICGPEPWVNQVADALRELGVKEEWIKRYARSLQQETALEGSDR